MLKKAIFFGTLVGIGFLFGVISGAIASAKMHDDHNMQTETSKTTQLPFKSINQPLSNKILVTIGGVGLISAELWWFLLSQPKSKKNKPESSIQEE